jgi:hypothetical protein
LASRGFSAGKFSMVGKYLINKVPENESFVVSHLQIKV